MEFSVYLAAISGNINRDNPPARDQLTAVSKDQKIVINIDRTDAETMKHVVIFLYTGRCELNESNGKQHFRSVTTPSYFEPIS